MKIKIYIIASHCESQFKGTKQSQLVQWIASLRFTPLAMINAEYLFLE